MTPLFFRTHGAALAATLLVTSLIAAGPIAQLPDYHAFADTRTIAGLAHGADVLSNLGFLLVGVYGLWGALRSPPQESGQSGAAYAVFCCALIATAAGSSWYHLLPDDARLVWDRIPIALACAAVLARAPDRWLAPLVLYGVASVFWWSWTGDLRAYLLLQAAPLLLVPLLQWRRGDPLRERVLFAVAVALYALAKVAELADHVIYACLTVVSGHTLKHLLATFAALVLVSLWQPAGRADRP